MKKTLKSRFSAFWPLQRQAAAASAACAVPALPFTASAQIAAARRRIGAARASRIGFLVKKQLAIRQGVAVFGAEKTVFS